MRLPKYSLLGATLGSIVCLGILYHQRRLEQGELDHLRHQSASIHYRAYQREQARQVTASQELLSSKTPSMTSMAIAPISTGYRNQGKSTPQAAIQTFAWACERGDVLTVAEILHFDPDQHREAENFMNSLPAANRSHWHSVEEMAAEFLIVGNLARPLPRADILSAVPVEMLGEDRATVLTTHRMEFRKVGTDWKYLVSAPALEQLGRQLLDTLGKSPAP